MKIEKIDETYTLVTTYNSAAVLLRNDEPIAISYMNGRVECSDLNDPKFGAWRRKLSKVHGDKLYIREISDEEISDNYDLI